MRRYRRNRKGNQISELAPALFIILVVVLFPMILLLYMGIGYSCGWYLNHISTRAVAIVPAADEATALANMESAFFATGMAAFTKASLVAPQTVDRLDIPGGHPTRPDIVRVTTRIQIEPLVIVPFIPLQPLPFQFVSERPIEEHGII